MNSEAAKSYVLVINPDTADRAAIAGPLFDAVPGITLVQIDNCAQMFSEGWHEHGFQAIILANALGNGRTGVTCLPALEKFFPETPVFARSSEAGIRELLEAGADFPYSLEVLVTALLGKV